MEFSQAMTKDRMTYHKLLLAADEDEKMLNKYIDQGKMFVAKNSQQVVAVAIVVQTNPDTVELKNISVDEKFQHQGIGSQFLKWIERQLVDDFQYFQVGTGDGDIQNISFYLKNGFRFFTIRHNFFQQYDHAIVVNGIELVDMVVLKKLLHEKND